VRRELVDAARLAAFAERQGIPGIDRAERGAADVGEHKPTDPVLAGLLSNLQRCHVPASPTGEADRPVPASRIGEHPVRSGCPGGEGPGLRCRHRRRHRQAQQESPGGVAGVSHRVRLDHQVGDRDGGNAWPQPAGGAERPQLVAQFAALIADQPASQPPSRLGAGTAIEHDLAGAAADQKPGRWVARGVHRPDAEQGKP
jgi:hypothetical protein